MVLIGVFSSQKVRIAVRPMDPDVAQSAALISRIEQVVRTGLKRDALSLCPERPRSVMAFETERKSHGAPQQFCVHGTVRHVASLAAFHPYRCVLEHERTALIHVAF